jgi:site-specific recombinase XerC
VATKSTEEEKEMIHRPNYHQVNRFLNHLAKDNQLDPDSIGHYKEYLNVLLRWADETPLCLAHTIAPSLPDYLAMPAHYGLGAESTLKKTVQTIKRTLTWLKLDSPTEFKPLP